MKMQLAALCLAVGLTGCGSTLSVHKGENKIKGVPFYIHRGCCKQTTVWHQPVYTLTLKKEHITFKDDGKDIVRLQWEKQRTLSQTHFDQHYGALRSKVDTRAPESQVLAKWARIPSSSARPNLRSGPAAPPDFVLVENKTDIVTYVDYKNPHTYNVDNPLIGSSTAAIKLSGQGTLTEGSGTVENKIAETVLATVPVKELLTAKLIPAAAVAPDDSAQAFDAAVPPQAAVTETRISLGVATSFFSHTLSKYSNLGEKGKCVSGSPLDQTQSGIEYARQAVAGGKKEEKKNEVTFSGSVVLPDSKAAVK